MLPRGRNLQPLAIAEAEIASMVSELQTIDELVEVGGNPEEEVNPFGSAAHRGLDPKTGSDL